MRTIFLVLLSLTATITVAQQPATKAPTAVADAPALAYTPDPVSTTYRRLTGKLFFSDVERERLNKARRDGVQIVDGEVVARAPQLNGFVKRSDGRTTYWVDGGQHSNTGTSTKLEVASGMIGGEPRLRFVRPTPAKTESSTPTNQATKPARTPPRKSVEPAQPSTKQP